MIFEITLRTRKPDNTLEEQMRVVQATDFATVLTWLVANRPATIEGVKVEKSEITNIDTLA